MLPISCYDYIVLRCNIAFMLKYGMQFYYFSPYHHNKRIEAFQSSLVYGYIWQYFSDILIFCTVEDLAV